MNKIKIENDIVKSADLSSKVKISFSEKSEEFTVNKLVIDIIDDCKLEVDHHNNDALKLDILIRISKGVTAKILEIRTGQLMKVRYRYDLDNNSTLIIQKFYHTSGMKELDHIHLNGEGAKIEYTLKTISTSREKYDITVYHDSKQTESIIKTGGVNLLEGNINFHVTGIVPNGKTGCQTKQNNQIINLSNQKCAIYPNLFIDEYDVIASHSAWIGTFKEDELWYLQSRGLDEKHAMNLLMKGFLLSNLELSNKRKEAIVNIINEYWR